MRRTAVLIAAGMLALTVVAPSASAHEGATGLDRAAHAALEGLAKAQKTAFAHGQPDASDAGHGLTGRERAVAAISKAMERGNGNGNAYGRGNALYVHSILSGGGIPGQMDDENHGQAVSALVHAYNELRKASEGDS